MNWLENAPGIVLGGSSGLAFLFWMARKTFVNWSKENVIVESADATAAMMSNFKGEIQRLSENNKELADENRQLQRQINRLEAILQKIAVKFDIELAEYADTGLH